MPAAYTILPDLNLLYIVGAGSCTGRDYLSVNRAAAADPARRPSMDTVIDMHGITAFGITMEELHEIVALDRRLHAEGVYGRHFRTALVVRSEEEEMIGLLYNQLVKPEGMGVQVFHRMDRALAWLGLEAARPALDATARRLGRTG